MRRYRSTLRRQEKRLRTAVSRYTGGEARPSSSVVWKGSHSVSAVAAAGEKEEWALIGYSRPKDCCRFMLLLLFDENGASLVESVLGFGLSSGGRWVSANSMYANITLNESISVVS